MKYIKTNAHKIYENLNTEDHHLNPKDTQEHDSGNSPNNLQNSKSFGHKKASSLQTLPNFPNQLPSQKVDNIIHIWGSNNDPINYEDENLYNNNSFYNNNNAKEPKFIEPSSVKIPKRLLFKSSMNIQTKCKSIMVYERQSNDFLSILQKKIKQISSILKKDSNAFGLNTIKFTLSITISLMETMKSNPNIDLIRLENVKNKFIHLLAEFQNKFPRIKESQSLVNSFQIIFKCLEAYISEHQSDDIILRVGSQEDLPETENKQTSEKKATLSNPFIERDPEFEWRTRLMKSKKFGNLTVQTKDLEDFRYIGDKKKINSQEQKIVQRKTLLEIVEEHSEIIITFICALIIMFTMIIYFFTR